MNYIKNKNQMYHFLIILLLSMLLKLFTSVVSMAILYNDAALLLFATPHSVTSYSYFDIDLGGGLYTTKPGQHNKSGLSFSSESQLLNI